MENHMESDTIQMEKNGGNRKKVLPVALLLALLPIIIAALGVLIFFTQPVSVQSVDAFPPNTPAATFTTDIIQVWEAEEEDAALFGDIWAIEDEDWVEWEEEGEDIVDMVEPEPNEDSEDTAKPKGTDKPKNTDKPKSTPKPTPKPTTKPDNSEYPYLVYVSKNSYTIAILGLDDKGEYTKVLRKFSTGIGRSGAQTRAGTFKITGKERWHKWGGGQYSPYATKYSSGVYIHGPLYKAQDPNKMEPGSYNAIGTACSSGCLRTTCSAAAWIYYNCKVGTTVIVANDSKYSTPAPAKIPYDQTWDPTDPGATPEVPVTSFTLSPTSAALTVGESLSLLISSIKPSDTSTKTFLYSSSNTSVATVDSKGVVRAVGPGTAVITVTADDVSGVKKTCTVVVTGAAATPTPSPSPAPSPTPTRTPTPTFTPTPTPTPAPPDPED
ncbi:MAG: Ig-like domain-containing protein [Clostridiales bacterium]|nr:Ig-like domain-containing protein [Clostridiales bacterium]